jgi:poly-gamma-glutamate system protein
MGMLDAKRTATNPDLAAAIVRAIADMQPPPNGTAVILVSGSILGADIAAIAAVESLGLEPLLISSVGASMFGATDPDFTWLDIEALLVRAGIVRVKSSVAVIGGGGATGGGLSPEGRDMIRASATRNGIPLLEEASVELLIDRLQAMIAEHGPTGLLINAGGSVAALGTCIDGDRLPAGLIRQPAPCAEGVPGLIVRLLDSGVPVLHLLNMRSLAAAWNLPYDPIPLPIPGNNKLIYGAGPSRPAAGQS